jgi:hypothetical protein
MHPTDTVARQSRAWARGEELNPTGRIGLFVGGYFALGLVYAAFEGVSELLGSASLLVAVLAGALAGGMLHVADRTRATELEPLGIIAAFGSTLYVALAVTYLGRSTGADGSLLFWTVVLASLPVALATLLWMPHPILGANVAVAVAVFVIAAPLGDDGESIPGGKALLLGLVLAALAVIVDLRTASRAGSLLHYSAVAVLAVAKLIIGIELDALIGGGVIAGLAVGELGVALLMRRRSWAVSAWVTLVLAGAIAAGASLAGALAGSTVAGIVAVPLIYVALNLQRHGEEVRAMLLAALPTDLAASFPP